VGLDYPGPSSARCSGWWFPWLSSVRRAVCGLQRDVWGRRWRDRPSLWFYISGLAILVGAELNAEIEHASPYGKAPGEKVPGQKKKIGIAAARAYKAQLEQRSRLPASHPGPRPVAVFDATPSANDRKLGAAVGLPLVLARLWNRMRRRPEQGA
jgi:hypothetical protein